MPTAAPESFSSLTGPVDRTRAHAVRETREALISHGG